MKAAVLFVRDNFRFVMHGGWGVAQWALWLVVQLPVWLLFGYLVYERKTLAYRIMVVALLVEAAFMMIVYMVVRWPRLMHGGWWFPVVLPLVWIGFNCVVSYTGGWWDLAKAYPLDHEFPEKQSWRAPQVFLSALGTYRNLVHVGVDREGLYLRVAPLFRVAHPPIFVPWKDISYSQKKRFFREMTKFRFRHKPDIPVHLPIQLTNKVAEAAAGYWPN